MPTKLIEHLNEVTKIVGNIILHNKSTDWLKTRSRHEPYMAARAYLVNYMRNKLNLKDSEIGEYTNRERTTIINTAQSYESFILIKKYKDLYEAIDILINKDI